MPVSYSFTAPTLTATVEGRLWLNAIHAQPVPPNQSQKA